MSHDQPSLEIHLHLIVENFFEEIVHQTFGSSVDEFWVDIEYKHQHVDAILHHPTSKIPFRKWLSPFL
jgi:hypothetical protein